jgi:hypothetical protein
MNQAELRLVVMILGINLLKDAQNALLVGTQQQNHTLFLTIFS